MALNYQNGWSDAFSNMTDIVFVCNDGFKAMAHAAVLGAQATPVQEFLSQYQSNKVVPVEMQLDFSSQAVTGVLELCYEVEKPHLEDSEWLHGLADAWKCAHFLAVKQSVVEKIEEFMTVTVEGAFVNDFDDTRLLNATLVVGNGHLHRTPAAFGVLSFALQTQPHRLGKDLSVAVDKYLAMLIDASRDNQTARAILTYFFVDSAWKDAPEFEILRRVARHRRIKTKPGATFWRRTGTETLMLNDNQEGHVVRKWHHEYEAEDAVVDLTMNSCCIDGTLEANSSEPCCVSNKVSLECTVWVAENGKRKRKTVTETFTVSHVYVTDLSGFEIVIFYVDDTLMKQLIPGFVAFEKVVVTWDLTVKYFM